MSDQEEKFATQVGCMDGRSIKAVQEFLIDQYHVNFVDATTEPGMDGFCEKAQAVEWERLRQKVVDISVLHHGSRVVAVVGHAECAGHPVSMKEHISCIQKGLKRVSDWDFKVSDPIMLIGIWVSKIDGVWTVEVVDEIVKEPTSAMAAVA